MPDEFRLARSRARAQSAIAAGVPVVAMVLWLTRPGFMEPMFDDHTSGMTLAAVAVIGFIVGLMWIHRIASSISDDGDPTWRYRDR